ncbi:galactokinase [Dermabacteraceae bacterium TAE3-ERU27]|nr:galactokinase [Dermabacteraceae bacterium TAE3-ERU27]
MTAHFNDAPEREATAQRAREKFIETYGYEPDGVWSAPGRVNIIGEHVDYQAGLCVPMAISHRCYVAAARTPENTVRMRSLQSEETFSGDAREFAPGKVEGWPAYVAGCVWAVSSRLGGDAPRGVDILVDGYVPLGSGLSSSASLECGVVAALNDLMSLGMDEKEQVEVAIRAENEFCGANTGGLDQSASVRCREGGALLLDCADFTTSPLPWNLETEDLALLIVDTRAEHSHVTGEYADRRAASEAAAQACGVETLREVADAEQPNDLRAWCAEKIGDETVARRGFHVISEIARVKEFVELLGKGELRPRLARIGQLLNESHDSLRDNYEVTCPELDTAVDAAREAGAHGARMTGGGFGGSAIALVEAEKVTEVADAIAAAFAAKGFKEPAFFVALPSAGAGRDL